MPTVAIASRRGLLRPRVFRRLLLATALLAPAFYFPSVLVRFTSAVPCGRPHPNCGLTDPGIATSVLGRAIHRFETGRPLNVDERVFAPYASSWALSEGYPVQAAIGWPAFRLLGSYAAAYNLPFLLGCVAATLGAGLLLAELAGPGWAALLGALLFAWGPGRLNNLGVLTTIWAGFVPLVLALSIRFLRRGRPRDAALACLFTLVLGLGSLYGLFLGGIASALVLVAAAAPDALRRRRLGLLALGMLPAAALLLAVYLPNLRAGRELEAKASLFQIETHAADLLSLLHEGVFSGPLRTLLDPLTPGFREGAAAFFPTVTFLGTLVLGLAGASGFCPSRRGRPERDARLWIFLAALFFVFALGPTVRLAGRPLFPGPWRLVAELPVFSTLRGIHRWDQWFDLSVVAAAALLLGRAFRRRPRLVVPAALLVLLDVWPRPVPAIALPGPSPFDTEIRALPEDAIVGDYPFTTDIAVRSWLEQLHHGRRLLVGHQSFNPPIHVWVQERQRTQPVTDAIAIYRELGVRAFRTSLRDLDPADRLRVVSLLSGSKELGVTRGVRKGDDILLHLEPRAPILVDACALEGGLSFRGGQAFLPARAGRLAFRVGPARLPVTLKTREGTSQAFLELPVVGVGGLPVRLSVAAPPGSLVIDRRSGRVLGRVA